ncbi:MAG: Extracellular ligand-binding receptor, partial [Frankiales bacterium]|nr:Extracellular ligand-binding receptor [Frankiales bacterium]
AVPGTTGSRASTAPGAGPAAPVAAGPVPAAGVVRKGAPIRIGSIVTQTGAINFAAAAQGTKAYVDKVNAAGGVNGRTLELDLRDDQLDAARGRQQAQQMLAGGVFAFVGWQAPLTENGIVPFLEQNKVPLVGAFGQVGEYDSPYSYVFQSNHLGYQMGRMLGSEKVTRAGLIYISNQSAAANSRQEKAFAAGLKSVGKSFNRDDIAKVDVTKASYDDVVTQFRLSGVDGIATIIDQTADNRLQQAMDRQDYTPVHIADPLFTDPTVKQGRTTEGVLVASDFAFLDGGGPQVQEYASAVRKQFGSRAQVSYLGLSGWFSAKVFVDALKRMGDDVTRPRLMATLDGLPPDTGAGFTSTLVFTRGAHDINRCFQLGRIVLGKVAPYKPYSCDGTHF